MDITYPVSYHYEQLLGYEERKSKSIQLLHSLKGSFVRKELEEIVDKNTILYPFTLIMGEMKLTLYSLSKDDRESWNSALKGVLGYTSLTDYYEVRVQILLLMLTRKS